MKGLAMTFAALLLSGCGSGSPALPDMAAGLWSVSTTNSNHPNNLTHTQICISHDPAYLASLKSYTDNSRATTNAVQKRSNEKRTATSWSYDFVTTTKMGELTGSRKILAPDDKHRIQTETTRGTLGSLAINTNLVTTSTWIGSDCGAVRPVAVRASADPENPGPSDYVR